ncbi:homogentisate 1 2-dioxygenase [Fusarium mexicanum]|uniref:homogentisate 1,2-dioxygenase n=1 Tax=Fusarium mexicanum TaxID=751941 RepID=A0A8H5JKN3_9HYPO|nr:homogentisate 1 2-dioxygenase [Fusarium mexicanum]
MPITQFEIKEKYTYLQGFNSYHQSEAIPGSLPQGCNSPQKCPLGLYAEKLSGTAFTAPRHQNKQSWLYRILPSAAHTVFKPYHHNAVAKDLHLLPGQIRWNAFDINMDADWVDGMRLIAGAGDIALKTGLGIFIYAIGKSMAERAAFYTADGDLLVVPQCGSLDIQTEFGRLLVRPNEIAVIPRGIRHRVEIPDGPSRGYICELYQGHFDLPDLGPIGSNGLANARDFEIPTAFYSRDASGPWRIISKFNDRLFVATQSHTPFDVVSWHGTYYPFKYDLGRFNTVGSISYDHPDPSIFTVLTAPSGTAGVAVLDFVIFPPRWLVQEDTFRPPWFHRNTMCEFMGLIQGGYDAKEGGGFQPGGASLHNIMSGHGPDAATFDKASNAILAPTKVGQGSMAFMFESCFMLGVSDWGLNVCEKVQEKYGQESWSSLTENFSLGSEK